MYYKFEDGKIKKADFNAFTLYELFQGKFIFKVELDGVHPIYYASPEEELWEYLKNTGRTVDSLVTFVDNYLNRLKESGIRFDWEGKTWLELMEEMDKFKKTFPDTIKSEIKEQRSSVDQSDSRSAKFNELLK